MSEVIIKLENVSKFYKLYDAPKDRLKEALHPRGKKYHKPFYALRGLNLEIKKGDVLGVVGRNGSGKSTLLKLITGVLQPNEGIISVKGKVTALLELGAGFNPEFSGIDNIKFYTNILGISHQELEEKLPSIIAFAELGDFLYQPVKNYSSGMKARLGFAAAVHVDPEILVLDEVLAVGDVLFRRKCYAKMEEFFEAGKTIIYVSHEANSVNRLCNRAVLLHEANIILDDEPKKVTQYYEKILFSKTNQVEDVIAEISAQSTTCIADKSFPDSKNIKSKSYNVADEIQSARFLSNLQAASTVKIKNYNVDIYSPKVMSLDGSEVNALVFGEDYVFTFCVTFDACYRTVSFGSQIKSLQGQTISLRSLQTSQKMIAEIQPGNYLIKWSFSCMMLPGDYYFDCSTTALISDFNREVLCRIKDAYMVRVIKPELMPYRGLVSLNQNIEVEEILIEPTDV